MTTKRNPLLFLFILACGIILGQSGLQFQRGVQAQGTSLIGTGEGIPSDPCTKPQLYVDVDTGVLYACVDGAWMIPPIGNGLPSGLAVFSATACPSGFTEAAAVDGKMILGTVAANMNAGTTGGADDITPTVASLEAAAQVFTGDALGTHAHTGGTYSAAAQIFSGSALGTHAHTGGTYTAAAQVFTGASSTDVVNHVHTLATGTGGTGNFSQVVGTVDTSSGGTGGTPTQTTLGTRSVATVNGVASYTPTGTNGTSAVTGTGQAVSAGTPAGTNAASAVTGTGQAVSGGTPAGTNATSAVTGTLDQFDNRSAFIRAIVCVAN